MAFALTNWPLHGTSLTRADVGPAGTEWGSRSQAIEMTGTVHWDGPAAPRRSISAREESRANLEVRVRPDGGSRPARWRPASGRMEARLRLNGGPLRPNGGAGRVLRGTTANASYGRRTTSKRSDQFVNTVRIERFSIVSPA